MNINNTMGLTASNFRRILTEHGRSSAPGLLESPITPKQRRKLEDTLEQPASGDPSKSKDVSGSASKVVTSAGSGEQEIPAKEMAEIRSAIKVPVSKIKNQSASNPRDSYSFYTRTFRVHGKQAWEYAMRDLGSIDTLTNRYGYVEPHQRFNIAPRKDIV